MFDQLVKALSEFDVVLEPDEDTPEWWAGAPSVCLAGDGTFYMAARMREGRSPRGLRGYEIRILASADGRNFAPIRSLPRDQVGVAGFERPALVRDPASSKFRLYGCCPLEAGWSIVRFDDADSPADFDPAGARTVLSAEYPNDGFVHVTGYKDPFVFRDKDRWHMFVIGSDRVERVHHFTSADGDIWQPVAKNPVMDNTGWHNFYTRPACVVPMTVGYLFVYEGSNLSWRDPVYNIATGLAYTPDLESFVDLTPEEPLVKSPTPGDYITWRYSHWVTVGGRVFVYAEVSRPNNTNEIRLSVFDADYLVP